MEQTPRANRIHIGIYGRCNSGKSSLINAITGQQTAVVSEVAGTTTDTVNKSMELPGVGAVTFIDTAGFDDTGELGAKRLEQTRKAADRTDVAVIVHAGGEPSAEREWIGLFGERNIPVVLVLNKADLLNDEAAAVSALRAETGINPIAVSALTGKGIGELIAAIAEAGRGATDEVSITGNLAGPGDVVMLVMPQDAQAPKGRLILPQVQTIRELLDKGCTVISCVPEGMRRSLDALSAPPKLVITDSQAFATVSALTPPESLLTSFSVLFANYKGDIRAFMEGAAAIDRLTEQSRVLIAEACTHAPATEDIGRVKIPAPAAQTDRRRARGGYRRRSRFSERPLPLRPGHPLRSLHVQPPPRPLAPRPGFGAAHTHDQLRHHDSSPDGHSRPGGLSGNGRPAAGNGHGRDRMTIHVLKF